MNKPVNLINSSEYYESLQCSNKLNFKKAKKEL